MSRIDDALHDLRSLDKLAARPSALSKLDPRAKILATFAFIAVVVSFDRYSVLALLPLALTYIYPDSKPEEIFADADLLARCQLELPLSRQPRKSSPPQL